MDVEGVLDMGEEMIEGIDDDLPILSPILGCQ